MKSFVREYAQMLAPAKETVIIVHGTWANPDLVKRRWYEPVDGRPGGEQFPAKLDAALQERGSPARCWAHCTEGNPIFYWSGENNWIARTRAASALADYVAKLRKEGWRCHIVAHSHGGNVAIEALPQIIAAPSSVDPVKMVTLGTPFMDTLSPVLRRVEWRNKVLGIGLWMALTLAGILLGLLMISLARLLYDTIQGNSDLQTLYFNLTNERYTYAIPAMLFGLLLIGLLFRRRTRRPVDNSRPWPSVTKTARAQPALLVLGSRMDEAWQVLHHIATIDNPLAPGSGLFSFVLSFLRSTVLQNLMIARILGARSYSDLSTVGKLTAISVYLGAIFTVLIIGWNYVGWYFYMGWWPMRDALTWAVWQDAFEWWALWAIIWTMVVIGLASIFGESFFSAILTPFRWLVQRLSSLTSVFPAVGTYLIRYFSWPVLRKMVIGLEGYPFRTPLVEQYPGNIPKTFGKYENMPNDAEQRALDKRSAWIARNLGEVSHTFSKLAVAAADITSLLRAVEVDQTLVHAAYYTDDECIARIADWIAGTDHTVTLQPQVESAVRELAAL